MRFRPTLPDPATQYRISDVFVLHDHEPPTTSHRGRLKFRPEDFDLEMEPNGRLENCRRHTVQPAGRPTREISLLQPLATGLFDLRYAQVWKVESEGREVVARFYDPLYVHDDTQRYDIFKHIDNAVANEMRAYGALADLQGILVPRFIGCFLTMVAAPPGLEGAFPERSVLVILLEFIPGDSLRHLNPTPTRPVCDTHKAAILDAALLAAHLLVLRGIRHSDMAERNIILKERPLSDSPFCAAADCDMRLKIPAKSMIQSLATSDQLVDYSSLTLQQIGSLPIAIIDFEHIELVDDLVAKREERLKRGVGIEFPDSRKYFAEISRPERKRDDLIGNWACSCSNWVPSTHQCRPYK